MDWLALIQHLAQQTRKKLSGIVGGLICRPPPKKQGRGFANRQICMYILFFVSYTYAHPPQNVMQKHWQWHRIICMAKEQGQTIFSGFVTVVCGETASRGRLRRHKKGA